MPEVSKKFSILKYEKVVRSEEASRINLEFFGGLGMCEKSSTFAVTKIKRMSNP
jgi:hypothetical protein